MNVYLYHLIAMSPAILAALCGLRFMANLQAGQHGLVSWPFGFRFFSVALVVALAIPLLAQGLFDLLAVATLPPEFARGSSLVLVGGVYGLLLGTHPYVRPVAAIIAGLVAGGVCMLLRDYLIGRGTMEIVIPALFATLPVMALETVHQLMPRVLQRGGIVVPVGGVRG